MNPARAIYLIDQLLDSDDFDFSAAQATAIQMAKDALVQKQINTLVALPLPALFEFASFEDWRDNAQNLFWDNQVTAFETICLDTKGRVCLIGRHFMLARDEQTFPVLCFLSRSDMIAEKAVSK